MAVVKELDENIINAWVKKATPREYLMEEGTGFGLRANKVGASWIARYKTRPEVLGRLYEVPLEVARENARRLLAHRRSGVFLTRTEKLTLQDLSERYLAVIAPKKGGRTRREELRLWRKILACKVNGVVFAEIPVEAISTYMLAEWHAAQAATPTSANRCLSLLSNAMSKARIWGIRDDNPCTGIERFDEVAFEHALTIEQFRAVHHNLIERLARDPAKGRIDHRVELYLLTLLWSGCRSSEPLPWRREWVSEDGWVRIPTQKSNRRGNPNKAGYVFVPIWLPPVYKSHVRHWGSEYVFPALRDSAVSPHLTRFPGRTLWLKIQEDLGIDAKYPLKIFRHTLRTLALDQGTPTEHTSDILRMTNCLETYRHTPLGTTGAAYQELADNLLGPA